MFEKTSPQEAAGHNSGPPEQTYYCGSECNFKWKEISSDKVKETKKVKEKTLAKEKIKGMLEKKKKTHQHQEAAGHTSGPPTQQTHYLGSILLMKKTFFLTKRMIRIMFKELNINKK